MRTMLLVGMAALMVAGCEGPDGADGAAGANGSNGADGVEGPEGPEGPAGADGGTPGADGADGADGTAGADGADGADGAAGTDGSDGADGADSGDFVFRTDAPATYAQLDRMGMPAVNTALITSKDDYNADETGNSDYSGEIVANLASLHLALDDDLTGEGLSPCSAPGDGTGTCVAQGAPLVIPDTLVIDLSGLAGFPNGRLLPDPVIDVTLAVVLLDLSVNTPFDLVGLSQDEDDGILLSGFPFLAEPN